MTETAYILSVFEERFRHLCGARIAVHGTGAYAREIIRAFDNVFHFTCVLSDTEEESFEGKRIIGEAALAEADIAAVILTEQRKEENETYHRLKDIAVDRQIRIFNMYGIDEDAVREAYEASSVSLYKERRKLIGAYDVIGFELMGMFLPADEKTLSPPRRLMLLFLQDALEQGKKVFFSLRKSFDRETQIRALISRGIFTADEAEKYVIDREGEDLSFRRIREENPGKKILYFGTGFINEFLLPRCYGIDTVIQNYGTHAASIERRIAAAVRRSGIAESGRTEAEELKEKIRAFDVISFDIFDTLLLRQTLIPEDVFLLAAKEMHKEGVLPESVTPEAFSDIREKALIETDLHADIDRIYEIVAEKLSLPDGAAGKMTGTEICTEKKVLFARTAVCKLLEYAVSLGRTVVLTSDMYLPSGVLADILADKGFSGFSKIYVSCEYRCMKRDGLFRTVRKDFPGKRILHFGDSADDDIRPAKEAGIEAIKIPSALALAMEAGFSEAIGTAGSLDDRNLIGYCISHAFADPFRPAKIGALAAKNKLERYALTACFPVIAGYLFSLIQRAEGAAEVLFSSRDGWILRQVYAEIAKRSKKSLPAGKYIYVNRHAMFLPNADREDLIDLILHVRQAEPEELLRNVYGIDAPDLREAGEDPAAYIRRHMDRIRPAAAQARENTYRYFEKARIPDGPLVFSDFVAAGNTQRMMELTRGSSMEGYYVGRPFYHKPLTERISYYIDDCLHDFFETNYMEMEYFMTSPEPAVYSYDAEGQPVFAKEVRTPEMLREIAYVHEKILSATSAYLDLFYHDGIGIDPEAAAAMYGAEDLHGVGGKWFDDWTGKPIV